MNLGESDGLGSRNWLPAPTAVEIFSPPQGLAATAAKRVRAIGKELRYLLPPFLPSVLALDQLGPRVVVDHATLGQPEGLLLGLDRGFRIRAEDAVDRDRAPQRSEEALQSVHHPVLRLVLVTGLQLGKSDIHVTSCDGSGKALEDTAVPDRNPGRAPPAFTRRACWSAQGTAPGTPGQVTGYAVALAGDTSRAGGRAFGCGKLAADLSLPKLPAHWDGASAPTQPRAQFTSEERNAIWEHAARTAKDAR
jgi:hypothetical protein